MAGRRDGEATRRPPTRRRVLRTAAAAGGALAVGGGLALLRRLRPPEDSRGGPGVLPPFITPIGSFYAFANGPWPEPRDPSTASLHLAGPGSERAVRWAEVLPHARQAVVRTLECDGNGYISAAEGPLGCELADPDADSLHPPAENWSWRFGGIGNAEWETCSLAELFTTFGVSTAGPWLLAEGRDGYRRCFPREVALSPDFRVAMSMNGEPLPHAHGAPARLLVPGQYGAMNVKWVASLRFGPLDDAREAQGGARTHYPVRPLAFATMPEDRSEVGEEVLLAGIAFAGAHPVKEVVLWTDDEHTWTAELVDPPQPYVWTRWRSVVRLAAGEHRVHIACVDSAGRQSSPQKAWGEAIGYGGLHVLRLRRV